MRDAKITRLRISRPNRSVANGARQLGRDSIKSKFCSSGGWGARRPAKTATRMIPQAHAPPIRTTALCSTRRNGRAHRIGAAAAGGVPMTPSVLASTERSLGAAHQAVKSASLRMVFLAGECYPQMTEPSFGPNHQRGGGRGDSPLGAPGRRTKMSTTFLYRLPVEQTEWKVDGQTTTAFTWEYED